MKSLTLGVLAVALMLAASFTYASAGKVKGVIGSVTEQSLQVMSKEAGTKQVRTDNNTSYMKWITHKPLGQDTRLDNKSLLVGRCVDVELRATDAGLAKVVRISDEPAGALFDPCKGDR
ncbi:MAG TPA: hypothetical protein VGZ27_00325 [Vicinamibacterales bacterium]|jgi:hypothetical protein|nr:hypothetical protein [Vicinamibacterales bacterium]